uniref:BZIP domain-containing protein n=1 Tax=Hyaloperonospora arabidopsidis (strain Emoy2) TaxID=559515 RepID=M4C033_HYAAE
MPPEQVLTRSSAANTSIVATSQRYDHHLPIQQQVTLHDVEQGVLQLDAELPPDLKRRMVKAEFKRLKHCETVRQSRVRKKNQRKGLQQVNAELESQLQLLLRAHDNEENTRSNLRTSSSRADLVRRFVDLMEQVRSLRTENSALRDEVLLYDALGEQLQRLQVDFDIPRALLSGSDVRSPIGTVHFEPLSVEEVSAILVASHEQATSFFETMGRVETAEEDKTMGWTQHQRITNDGRVQFNFTKRIETIETDELVRKSWEMYCDFGLYHGIYSSVQKLEILQRINDDTLLIRRDLQEEPSAPIFRTVFLLFRIKLPNGYLICFRSHNPAVCVVDDDDDPNVQWMEMFYWLMITDPNVERGHDRPVDVSMSRVRGCDVSFGGNLLNSRSAKHATVWKYQIAMALLRWESNAVAPLFTLFREV